MDEQTRAAYSALLREGREEASHKGTSLREDYRKAFEAANKQLSEIDSILNPRGDNWAGAARNFLQGLVPGAARAEAVIRSAPSGFEDYSKYKENAFQSAEGYARENPEEALALNIGGALVPALGAYLLAPVTGGAPAATATANLAQKTSLGARMARSAGIGAGMGATYGFMNDPSEDLGERFGTGLGSGALGLALGGATPLALSTAGKAGNVARRVIRGIPEKSIPANVTEDYILNSGVLQNTPEQSIRSDILRKGAEAGARDIYDPAYMMNETLEASKNLRQPGILTNLTEETPAAQRILDAARTPQMDLAAQRYTDFVANSADTPGQGLVAKQFLRRNPIAREAIEGHPAFENVPVGSFEWFQKMGEVLDDVMPKNIQTKAMTARNNKLLTAKQDLAKVREEIHPGTAQANRDYAIGKSWQEQGNKITQKRLRTIAGQPQEGEWSLSTRGVLQLPQSAYQRGRARELILNSALYDRPAQPLENALSAEVQAILNGLRTVGN